MTLDTECPYVVAHAKGEDIYLGLPHRRHISFVADLRVAERSARALSKRDGYGEVIDTRTSRRVVWFENGIRRALDKEEM